MPPQADLLQQFIRAESLLPKQAWFDSTTRSMSTTQPLPATLKSLRFKLLASNLRETLQATEQTCFPLTIHGQHNTTVSGPVAVQVLEVHDMGTSLMEQLERIEMGERGESKKGHVITRIVEDEGVGEGSATQPASTAARKEVEAKAARGGPHKLLLEDAAGRRVYGLEMKPIEGVSTAMAIGAKLLLQNVKVARGVLLLEPSVAKLLGGKIEDLNKEYAAQRKASLEASIAALKVPNARRT